MVDIVLLKDNDKLESVGVEVQSNGAQVVGAEVVRAEVVGVGAEVVGAEVVGVGEEAVPEWPEDWLSRLEDGIFSYIEGVGCLLDFKFLNLTF